MPKTLAIIISGLPCTGKTTLGRRIAEELHLPFISRDDLKELLFDSLGWKDREWSKKLGAASWKLVYYCIELLLSTGQTFIVESNFRPELATKELLDLKNKYDFEPLQIHCKAHGAVLLERFRQRSESGERHPGHVDYLNYEEFRPTLLQDDDGLLDVGGNVFEIDTSDFERIDYRTLLEAINSAIRAPGCAWG